MRWYLKPEERLPQPPVREGDDRTPVLAGTVAWAVLAVIAWVVRDELRDDGHGWWVWTPVSGVVLGVIGLWYMHRRQVRAAEEEQGG